MNRKLPGIALCLALVVLTASAFAAENDPPGQPRSDGGDAALPGSVQAGGVIIGIIADKTGKVHYKNLLGYADVEAKKPISEDNVFWIASMSKMFAGASIMMLVDEGKVSLDDPVTKFIPQLSKWMVVEEKDASHVLLKPLVRPVTVRHILSHTSGLTGIVGTSAGHGVGQHAAEGPRAQFGDRPAAMAAGREVRRMAIRA